jgi:hypothetical protein
MLVELAEHCHSVNPPPILFCLAHKKRPNRSFETLAAHHQSAVRSMLFCPAIKSDRAGQLRSHRINDPRATDYSHFCLDWLSQDGLTVPGSEEPAPLGRRCA